MSSILDSHIASADPCDSLWSALDRLLNIGAFYPAGHARSEEAARVFLDEMRAHLADAPALTIDAGRGVLAVQGRVTPLESKGAKRLHAMLTSLGIARIEIDAVTSPIYLHAFSTLLLWSKHQADTAVGFREISFAGLPPTVRIMQREFGRRVGGGGVTPHTDQVQAAVAGVMQALEGRTLDDATRETYRDLIDRLFTHAAERLEMGGSLPGGAHAPITRSLDDVLAVGVHAIRHALHDLPADDTGDLRGLFACAERAIALSDDRPSVELMLDVLRQSAREAGLDEALGPENTAEDDALYEIPLAELTRRLTVAAGSPVTAAALAPVDRSEYLSIVLQNLLNDPPTSVFSSATLALRQALAVPLVATERAVMAAGARQLFERGAASVVDRLATHLFLPLRRISPETPAQLLRDACADAAPPAIRAAWPHVVNELLLSPDGCDPATIDALRRLATALPEEEMRRSLARLEALDALRDGSFARRPCVPLTVETAPLCAVLLESSRGDLLGDALLTQIQAAPPPWPGARALPLLGAYHPRHRSFLVRLLREGVRRESTPELRAATGRLLVEGLPSLPPSRRNEPWVPGAIRELGALRAEGARATLRIIMQERRLLILRAWPAACRAAAAAATADLDAATPRPEAQP
jgi:hypothetical protein